MLKRIGITMRVEFSSPHREPRDALARDWIACFENHLPEVAWVPIPNLGRTVSQFLDRWEVGGVILAGGNDVGECPLRDETESGIVAYCTRKRLPVLGVCRGLQLMQVLQGGTLVPVASRHQGRNHTVRVGGAPIADLFPGPAIEVNSYHNHGVPIGRLAQTLQAWLTSEDGLVEGLVHKTEPQIAVQWHPERPLPDPDNARRLLRFFAFDL